MGQSHHDLCQHWLLTTWTNDLPQCEFLSSYFLVVCFQSLIHDGVGYDSLTGCCLNWRSLIEWNFDILSRYRFQSVKRYREIGTLGSTCVSYNKMFFLFTHKAEDKKVVDRDISFLIAEPSTHASFWVWWKKNAQRKSEEIKFVIRISASLRLKSERFMNEWMKTVSQRLQHRSALCLEENRNKLMRLFIASML